MSVPTTIGLYVHIPWCVRKCPYCDFNSHPLRGALPEQAYTDVLLGDLSAMAQRVQGRRIDTVFFGGGTPSLMPANGIGRILAHADRVIGFTDTVEITLEANPGTVEHDSFTAYREVGVNRISLGVQSFDERALQRLGRIHSSDEARRAAEAVHAGGIERLNIDLMFGLPEQTPDGAIDDVTQALQLAPEHLSHYQLTLEPNTAFARTPPVLPDDELSAAMAESCRELIENAGLRRYEVSAYGRPGAECRHNLNYWRFGDYLGIGAGAHGKLTTPAGISRHHWTKHPRAYLGETERLTEAAVPSADLPFEFMMNALRLTDGIAASELEKRTGIAIDALEPVLAGLRHKALLAPGADRIRATDLGMSFLNDLLAEFLPPVSGAR